MSSSKNYNLERIKTQIHNFFSSVFSENKIITFTLILFILIGLFTGIFTGIKFNNGADIIFNDFSIKNFIDGKLGSSTLFFSRILSYIVVLGIIFVSSLNIYLIPLNYFIITYRSYLLGFNVVILFSSCGLLGILTTIFIIIPCHIILLVLTIMFSCFAVQKAICQYKYGYMPDNSLFCVFSICLILMILTNFIETLILFLFSSKIIFIV